ncbi:MAG: MBOAT family protein [Deltaproteobacteria bacterium]|nr:MBOAT family protein [Deltaproteobacteria bacterium]
MAANFLFYAWWDWRFCLLILVGAFVDFHLALKIADAPSARARRLWLLASVSYNLGLLAFFKYANFLADNLIAVLGTTRDARFDIVLPLGISFFTFQAMSYTLDVYRGQFPATRRFGDFAFSMTFFPHLIAGPIVRASHFMPQLEGEHPLRMANLNEGGSRFMRGFIKKVLFADTFAVCADQVFGAPAAFSTATTWLGVFAYSAQIYFDFSAYSDMAVGLARVFGFEFPENFRHPYLANNITDFWRRWHMSLSSWLRDYLYVSLGGNRRGRLRTYLNLALTMLLGGLWHGANWTFVLWGALHGAALAVHKWWLETLGPTRSDSLPLRFAGWAGTFVFVTLCWVPFRSPDMATAEVVASKLIGLGSGGASWPHVQTLLLLAVAATLHGVEAARPGSTWLELSRPAHMVACFAALLVALLFSPLGHSPFIYFQF